MEGAQKRKDIRLVIRVKNNLILSKMEECGIKSLAELGRKTNIAPSYLGELINMRRLPVLKNGAWNAHVERLAAFFKCLPEDLFSAEQMDRVIKQRQFLVELSWAHHEAIGAEDRLHLLGPEDLCQRLEVVEDVEEALASLAPRQRMVIRESFGIGRTDACGLGEIGEMLGVSKERVRQIESKGLNKLRLAVRSKHLKDHY